MFLTEQSLKTRTTLILLIGLSWAIGWVIDLDGATFDCFISDAHIDQTALKYFLAIAIVYYTAMFLLRGYTDHIDGLSERAGSSVRVNNQIEGAVAEVKKQVRRSMPLVDSTFKVRHFFDLWFAILLGIATVTRLVFIH